MLSLILLLSDQAIRGVFQHNRPIQGIQDLAGFELEPVAALRSERLAVFNSESVAVLIGIRSYHVLENAGQLQCQKAMANDCERRQSYDEYQYEREQMH